MSASSLASLLVRQTKDAILDTFVAFFRLAGFPVASWDPFSLTREETEAESSWLEDFGAAVANIAAGGFTSTAEGPWLDIISEDFFENPRIVAVFTQGAILLSDPNGVGPITKNAGEVWVANIDGTLRYVNLAGLTIPKNGSVSASFQAETAGKIYNLPNDTITQLVTSIAGITVDNPDPGTGTWITQQGADAEEDDSLEQRDIDQWSTLGTGANENAYEYWSKESDPQIRRVTVLESGNGDGKVDVYLAGASGPVTSDVATATDTFLRTVANLNFGMRTLGAVLTVHPANGYVLTLQGNVLATPTTGRTLADITADVITALGECVDGTEIGDTLYVSALIGAVQPDATGEGGVAGVYAVHLTAPAADVFIDQTTVIVLDTSQLTVALQ